MSNKILPLVLAGAWLLPLSAHADLASAIDTANLVTSSGDASWFDQSSVTHDTIDAAQSGGIGHDEVSVLTTEVTGPANVSFWWKVSSEENWDFLRFYISSVQNEEISGEVDWTEKTFFVGAGTHTLEWIYSKDGSESDGSDCGWVDQLVITPVTPPANDDFANRIDLGSGSTASDTGDNSAATLEAGEPSLSPYDGSSVWWSWTAPASGWTKVNTAGSGIATTIAIYTGTSVGSLTQVGWAAGFPTTDLAFEATAGTTYQIAIHGNPFFSGTVPQGAISLSIDNTYAPPAEITAMTMTPGSGDLGAGPVAFTLDIDIDCPAGLDEAEVFLVSPTGNVVLVDHFGAAERVSGTQFSGSYQKTVTVPGYLAAAGYRLRFEIFDLASDSAFVSDGTGPDADHVGLGLDFIWDATNTGLVDTTAPMVTGVSFNPSPVNIYTGSQNVDVDITLTDDLTGFTSGTVFLYDADDLFSQQFYISPFSLISGDANSGVARATFNIPDNAPTGTWRVEVNLRDVAGNERQYGPSFDTFPGGDSTAEFEVIDLLALDNAIDTANPVTTTGYADWFGQTSDTHDSEDAARSGAIPDEQESVMTATVTGPAIVSFWWQVSSEPIFDKLQYHLDGVLQETISGNVPWVQESFFVYTGSHEIKWTYSKDVTSSSGADAGWVDELVVTPVTPPSNDDFAHAITLSGTSDSDTGDNIYAGLESGEPDLGNYDGGSVWWQWTAPATGWARVDTAGSAIPTTVGVFTGASVSTLTPIGWNSGNSSPQGALTFPVVSGTTYHLAVHGNPAANFDVVPSGAVAIDIQSGFTPDLELAAVTLTPDSGDLGAGSVPVQVDFSATCPDGLHVAVGQLYDQSGTLLAHVDVEAGSPGFIQSGDVFSGSYRFTIDVPGYLPAGAIRLQLILIDDLDQTALWSDGTGPEADHALPSSDFTFTATNTGTVDATAPDVTALTFNPDPVNIHSGPAALDVDVSITDPLSGISSIIVTVFDSADNYQTGGFVDTILTPPVSGDIHAGTWRVPLTIPDTGPTGTWRVEITLQDLAGNSHYYGNFGGDPFPGGSGSAEFTVENVEPTNDYATWAIDNDIPDEPVDDDYDEDGIPNGVEAFLGTDPTTPDASPFVASVSSTGGLHLVIDFDRVEVLPDNLVIRVRCSNSLTGFATVAEKTGNGAWSGSATVNEGTPSGGMIPVTVEDPVTGQTSRFGILEADTAP